jgi:hypothetical protein
MTRNVWVNFKGKLVTRERNWLQGEIGFGKKIGLSRKLNGFHVNFQNGFLINLLEKSGKIKKLVN